MVVEKKERLCLTVDFIALVKKGSVFWKRGDPEIVCYAANG